MKIYYCKEKNCNNKICKKTALYGQGRCCSCSKKGKRNHLFGKHHTKKSKTKISKTRKGKIGKKASNYKNGNSLKKYHCKDCGKKINWQTAVNGLGRCPSCARKGKRLSKTTKQKISEATKGKNNPNYGKSHTKESKRKMSLSSGGTGIPYENNKYSLEFNNKLKYKIRKRDNFECQHCKMIEEEHLSVYGRVLEVHHINYNKINCKEDNLITTCKQCNLRANKNRDYWYAYYKYIMKEKTCSSKN